MTTMTVAGVVACLAGFSGSAAFGAVSIVQQGAAAPTYGTTLNFDEVGGPTGANVPANSWAGIGLDLIYTGEGSNSVSEVNLMPGFGWLGEGFVYSGAFGVFMEFGEDLTEFSAQYWDSSGPSTGFGGGAAVVVLKDGVKIDFGFIATPAYGGAGDTWIHITTDGGTVFDEVRFVGFGFFPEAFVDNISWNSVPAPASAMVAGLALAAGGRRRR